MPPMVFCPREFPTPTMADTASYREVVASLSTELGDLTSPTKTRPILTEFLSVEQAKGVLDASTGGSSATLVDRAARELQSSRMRSGTYNLTPQERVTILLLQQIDLAWWIKTGDFEEDADLESSPELVDLRALKREGHINFQFFSGLRPIHMSRP